MEATISNPIPTILETLTKSPLNKIIIRPIARAGTVNKKIDFFAWIKSLSNKTCVNDITIEEGKIIQSISTYEYPKIIKVGVPNNNRPTPRQDWNTLNIIIIKHKT